MLVDGGGGSVFTVPAGSPGAVRSVADAMVAVASQAAGLGPRVRRGCDAALESWAGASADAFSSYAASLVRLVDGCDEQLRAVGRVLHRYADALEVAQRAVQAAVQAAAAATEVLPEAESRQEAARAWRTYRAECAVVAGELDAIARAVAAATERNRVVEVLSTLPAKAGPPHLTQAQLQGLQMSLLDLQGARSNVFGWVGYVRYYERGAGSLMAQGRAWEASDDALRVVHQALEGGNWGELFRGGLTADQLGPTLTRLGTAVDYAGKSLGFIGVGLGVKDAWKESASGNHDRAAYKTVTTALGAAAALPPPAGLACGTAALAMTVGEVLYDEVPAVKEFVDGGIDVMSDVGDGVGDAVGDAVESLTDIF